MAVSFGNVRARWSIVISLYISVFRSRVDLA